ncbi:hypothetical protein [Actinoplanes derwentensis]|uniref:Putative acyl-CoA dehydrogenase n=1 Tax=Actinoplanes derwentensis TaxID=113562 RepID=A0A1H1U0S9_9ACTN|nr:hypothetical protein [Actinoplanes derwentensis]GID85160.1 hypothetical protein Ade03nite_40840 [Actinoplanes derwentensis]SDS65993.1 putative acyl-CoA dehydrogenase [Actinoplanes derwentensis]
MAATCGLVAGVLADPSAAAGQARRVVEALALALQGAVLIREALASRLGLARSLEYGALGLGLDLASIVARA